MPHCLTFAVRNRPTPLHFCFGSEVEARSELETFSRNIYVASDDELVLINNVAGFLKRSFVSVELESTGEDGGDGGNGDDDDIAPPPKKAKRKERLKRRRDRANKTPSLEAGLEQIMKSLK